MSKRIQKGRSAAEPNKVHVTWGRIRLSVSGKIAVIATAVVIVVLAALRLATS